MLQAAFAARQIELSAHTERVASVLLKHHTQWSTAMLQLGFVVSTLSHQENVICQQAR